jgi:GT2 family glycosyltransferase
MTDERQAQLRYARALLSRGRYRELLKRLGVAVEVELNRWFGASDTRAYRRWLARQKRDRGRRGQPNRELPRLSVMVITDTPGRLQTTLASIERQSLRAHQVLSGDSPAELLQRATGEVVAVLPAGDTLLPRAFELALEALVAHPEASLVYTDEGLADEQGTPIRPYFKPDYSPEFLLSFPYTGQLTLFRRPLIDRAGGLRGSSSLAAMLHDLTLRLTEIAPAVHLAELLYERRLGPGGDDATWQAIAAEAAARRGFVATVGPGLAGRSSVSIRRQPTTRPKVAIVIPFRNRRDLLERCIRSIRDRSTYDRYEILAVDNRSDDPSTLAYLDELARAPRTRVLHYPAPFNFAAINNFAACETDAEQLVLLNNDTEVKSRDWIEALLEQAERPEVGIVGARLLYPDGSLQHAGIVLGIGGLAAHPFDGWPHAGRDASQAFGTGAEVDTVREVSAVTAACVMIRRERYQTEGGMDAEQFAVSFNDVDLCLRLRQRGWSVIYSPHCELVHYTSATRKTVSNLDEDDRLQARWGQVLRSDPYYNPHLSLRTAYRPRFAERVF